MTPVILSTLSAIRSADHPEQSVKDRRMALCSMVNPGCEIPLKKRSIERGDLLVGLTITAVVGVAIGSLVLIARSSQLSGVG